VLALLAVEKTEPVLLLVNYLLESVFFQQLVRTQHLRVKFLAFEQQKQGLALLVEHVVEVVNAGNLLQVLLHREQHFLELVGLEDPELKDEHVLVARVQNRKVVKLCDYIGTFFFKVWCFSRSMINCKLMYRAYCGSSSPTNILAEDINKNSDNKLLFKLLAIKCFIYYQNRRKLGLVLMVQYVDCKCFDYIKENKIFRSFQK